MSSTLLPTVRAFGRSSLFRQTSTLLRSRHNALPAFTSPLESITTPVPVTLLSGFLGAGKTTALKNILENREGLRVGVIVNDVASVNIDAKLISNPGGADNYDAANGDFMADGGTVELQNGCACCSLADELMTSVEQLLTGRSFDAVVVELSGVADPIAVKSNWQQAIMDNHPATKLADINKIVTVVDSLTFGTDWMTWNSAGEREGWTDPGDDCAADRKVPELLAEQVEAADVLLINKVDLAEAEQVKTATSVARGLNDKAVLFETSFGKVDAGELIAMMSSTAVVAPVEKKEEEHSHKKETECDDPKCEDESHSHAHSHDHASDASIEKAAASDDCSDPGCTDTSHSHDHASEDDCSDPGCTDTSHSHSHDHAKTSTDQLGISSFVYKAAIPFNSIRLMALLHTWPVPIKDDLDLGLIQEAAKEGYEMEDGNDIKSPFTGVLRSKGFSWMAPVNWTGIGSDAWRHDTAMYWSHAGKHFGIQTAGKWWGTIDKEQMKGYFTKNTKEYERILKEDWVSDEFGDRRQELVFIGAGLDEKDITEALDECLCTDEEMVAYRKDLETLMDMILTTEAEKTG